MLLTQGAVCTTSREQAVQPPSLISHRRTVISEKRAVSLPIIPPPQLVITRSPTTCFRKSYVLRSWIVVWGYQLGSLGKIFFFYAMIIHELLNNRKSISSYVIFYSTNLYFSTVRNVQRANVVWQQSKWN